MATAMAVVLSCPHKLLVSRNAARSYSYPLTLSLRLRVGLVTPWCGLKQLPFSCRQQYCGGHREWRGKRRRGRAVYASLFGVGAPEALVIGVVALLVFGPKGLAEVARNLGKTLRSFQPTIKELQEVSREFKSTLEREIGLDEVAAPNSSSYIAPSSLPRVNQQDVVDPNGAPTTRPYSSEDLLKITEEQLAASAAQAKTQASAEGQAQASTASSGGMSTSPVSEAAATPSSPDTSGQSSKTTENER